MSKNIGEILTTEQIAALKERGADDVIESLQAVLQTNDKYNHEYNMKNGFWCECANCEARRKNEMDHLNHPFYKKVDAITEKIARDQIIKGAAKYDEPFNPASWSNRELVEHMLQELRDAQVYGVGLLERLEEQEKQLRITHNAAAFWKEQSEKRPGTSDGVSFDEFNRVAAEFWRLKYIIVTTNGTDREAAQVELNTLYSKIMEG